MEVYEISKRFPQEEKFSLTDQIRRSSRSVSGNIAEGWRKRRYAKSFIAKITDSEGEAAETQDWLDYTLACKYIDDPSHKALDDKYDHIISMVGNHGYKSREVVNLTHTTSPFRPVTHSLSAL